MLISEQSKVKPSDRTAKQLLGEFYVDKEFLEALISDRDFQLNPNENVKQLVMEGLNYLESRIDFWRQQKPIYARRKDSFKPKKAITAE